MKLPGWLTGKRRSQGLPATAQPTAPRQPVLTTDPRDAGGLTTLCPTYVIHPSGFEDLRHWRQMVAVRHPEALLLASLDNLSNASVRAWRAYLVHSLDDYGDVDVSNLPKGCFVEGAKIDYLTQQEEFPLRLAIFRKRLGDAPELTLKLPWVDSHNGISIEDVNADPNAVVHAPGIVQAVSVQKSADLLAAFPIGAYEDDLTPFELHQVISDLETIGYRLIALGACYVALWGEVGLDKIKVATRSQIVADLYEDVDIDALNEALSGKRHLILRHTN